MPSPFVRGWDRRSPSPAVSYFKVFGFDWGGDFDPDSSWLGWEGWAESVRDCGRGGGGGGVRVDICLSFLAISHHKVPPWKHALLDRSGAGRFGTLNLMGRCGRGRWEGLSYYLYLQIFL